MLLNSSVIVVWLVYALLYFAYIRLLYVTMFWLYCVIVFWRLYFVYRYVLYILGIVYVRRVNVDISHTHIRTVLIKVGRLLLRLASSYNQVSHSQCV